MFFITLALIVIATVLFWLTSGPVRGKTAMWEGALTVVLLCAAGGGVWLIAST
jgi:hypothetical protein